jgi:hypothetical protein
MGLPRLLDVVSGLAGYHDTRQQLPTGPGALRLGGLAGSSDAVLVAALARDLPQRLFVVVTDQLADAERWLADLQTLVDDVPVALYPPREGFGEVEPHAEVAGERVETLERLSRGALRVLLTTSRALLERTALPAALRRARLEIRKGDTRRPEALAAHLESVGFERVPMVEDVAQFSVRGGIFDIYGFGMAEPVRLEFWGDEIIELRHFDLNTQRTTRPADLALVLPVDGRVSDSGGETERVSVSELLGPDTIVVIPAGSSVRAELQRTWDESAHHIELARRRGEEAPPRDALFRNPEQTLAALGRLATLTVLPTAGSLARRNERRVRDEEEPQTPSALAVGPVDINFAILPPEPVSRDVRVLRRLTRTAPPTVILCDNSGQAERLDELLGEDGPVQAALTIGVLDGGFVVPGKLRVLTDHEIFRRDRRLRRARRYGTGAALDTIGALKPGDYVVHLEHGIGIYRGIERVFFREQTIEAAVIEYEGGDRLNVPLYRIDQVERYRSAGDVGGDMPPPRLHRLGGKKWQAQREKTRTAILEMTQELLELYARRRVATRPPHTGDGPWQRQLESSFLFEDTPDQRKATNDVKGDMEGERPMDRLLVGDVGYGKTEIAIRAAFKAVQSGRQVAVLVPTTILAEQHGRNFSDRLADFPVRVEVMSRFQTPKQQAEVVSALNDGTIDIVIGTHRLLSPDVQFKRLGLIVVDEEHRFGVKHKERLKQLKLDTDVLTLTATPIPRTLHQSLAGLRDMTLMQTRAARPVTGAHVRRAVGRWPARGGDLARARSGWTGLLRAQPHRDDSGDRRSPASPRAARSYRGGARSDEGAGARGGDEAVRRGRGGCARLDTDRGKRPRCAECEHHVREPGRPFRTRAALPAARARGAVAPARLLLSHRARPDGRGCGAAPAGARASHRARRGLPHRAQGHGAARGRQPARRRAVRLRAFRGLRPVPAPARRDGAAALAGGGRAPFVPADVSLDQPAYLPDDFIPRRTPSWTSTGASPPAGRPPPSTTCAPRSAIGSAPCRRRPMPFSPAACCGCSGPCSGWTGCLCEGPMPVLTFAPTRSLVSRGCRRPFTRSSSRSRSDEPRRWRSS